MTTMTEPSPYSIHEFSVDGNNDSWSNLFGFVPENSRVLDVGCSTGNFGEALERLKGCTVVGIDISEPDIAIASTRITRAEVADVTEPGALDDLGTFDVIIYADVLEHLVNARSALIASTAALNEGGSILFSIPNMAHLSVRLDLLEGRFGYTEVGILDKTHVHFHDPEAVDSLFADSGLDIVEESSVLMEYPRSWIDERLAGLGLAANDDFTAMLERSRADVFQIVGRATPSPTPPPAEASVRVRTFPPDEINAHVRALEADNQRLRDESVLQRQLDEQTARADDLERQFAALQARLAELRHHPVRAVARVVSSRLGRNGNR
jgi:2-polyprenyl-3-methyl-5-hydroxy-6-metoxy-1,4-benzoquinol methylase